MVPSVESSGLMNSPVSAVMTSWFSGSQLSIAVNTSGLASVHWMVTSAGGIAPSRRCIIQTLRNRRTYREFVAFCVNTDTVASHIGCTRIIGVLVAIREIYENITHRTNSMFALDGSFPAKPTTCSVIAVAVVRTVRLPGIRRIGWPAHG